MSDSVTIGDCRLILGDCRFVLPTLQGVDSVVTDPPYHLTSIVKRFGKPDSAPAKANGATGVYARSSRGFMGKQWDGGDIAFDPELWRLCFDALKPGGHLLAFGGTRTYHRMACAIEDAGFEIRDCIAWVYAQGFPKSHNISKAIATEDAKQWEGWGTAIKPAFEPIIVARKPVSEKSIAANVLKHGTGALNIDRCRVDGEYQTRARNTEGGNSIFGLGSGGGDFVPASGRWPANFIHDGSEEVVGLFPDTSSGTGAVKRASSSDANGNQGAAYGAESRAFGTVMPCIGDAGSAARFFYCAKADTDDRLGSKHPTVKPIDLMAYLVRLVTPPKGVVLDPFAGSGATGMACMREGMRCILIEKEREYFEDILNRVSHVRGDDTPLFKEPGPCQGRLTWR